MGRWDKSRFEASKKRKEFLLIGIAGGAGVLALAALGISKKGTGGTVGLTAPKIPYWNGSQMADSKAQYIAADPSISPISDNVIDLGDTTRNWRNIYAQKIISNDGSITFDTSANVADLIFNGGSGSSFRSSSDGLNDLGLSVVRWRNGFFADHIDIGNLRMSTNNQASSTAGMWLQTGNNLVLSGPAGDISFFPDGGPTRYQMEAAAFFPQPSNDNQKNLGLTTARWNRIICGPVGFLIYAASGDVQVQAQLTSDRVVFGPGGASVTDTFALRDAWTYGHGFAFSSTENNQAIMGIRSPSGSTTAIFALSRLNSISGNYEILEISSDNSFASGVFGIRSIAGGTGVVRPIYFGFASGPVFILPTSGTALQPGSDKNISLGTTTLRWGTVYVLKVESQVDDLNLDSNSGSLIFSTANAERVRIDGTSALFPSQGDNVVDLGKSVNNWNRLYFAKSSTVAPTTTDIPSGATKIWKNTTDGTVKLYYNDGGTLKSVTLT